ncbi:hypothetical protein HETIRDRAFT_435542 [Heterobasidion irregulare TC 32-1]|uniref:RED-like N-terminal domain-containing protein n=1 Tax=Heterobasidion irregulare (strain TC 32-1) TaxID=747525 RepID=W4K1R8_HETIT|nr:uncharacterized protein HETIRDRAFT_435542 [Heterobasidion irregulare TC 32-1]ETW79041.1 hypothetical protein HETIRDRAFT_435542 [Heterobasidion irregulare TC 32-1]
MRSRGQAPIQSSKRKYTEIHAFSWISATVSASEPAFKPRKLKKQSEKYRNRAEERRAGADHDYSQIEAVLEDFERQNADKEDRAAVEAQRSYLGGDSDHSILVKGLDFALLEQNKARLASASSKLDDQLLEEAFKETAVASTSSESLNPTSKKRSRTDILRELKEKRGSMEGVAPAKAQEESIASANVSAKFRPIGFKPIGPPAEEKAKKKKKVKAQDGDGAERKKKRRKVEKGESQKGEMGPPAVPIKDSPSAANAPSSTTTAPTVQKPDMEPESIDEDLDIFAGAGEYEGIDLGDDDDDDGDDNNNNGGEGRHREASPADEGLSTATSGRKWFDDAPQSEQPKSSTETATQATVNSPPPPPDLEEGEEETPMRLVPLASSAVPSISDLLAMDEAAEKETKRKARKEKKKGKGGGDKLDRDYQRLKSYEAKKAAS